MAADGLKGGKSRATIEGGEGRGGEGRGGEGRGGAGQLASQPGGEP